MEVQDISSHHRDNPTRAFASVSTGMNVVGQCRKSTTKMIPWMGMLSLVYEIATSLLINAPAYYAEQYEFKVGPGTLVLSLGPTIE